MNRCLFISCLLALLGAQLASQNPTGALSGREIVLSPGHGYYWHSSLGWTTQRPIIDGLVEDIHTHEIIHDHLLPWLEGSGARAVVCRARSRVPEEHVIDNDAGAPGYQETGSWITGASTGFGGGIFGGGTYRYTNTQAAGGSAATFTVGIQTSDHYPVYVAYRAGTNRTTSARVEIVHGGGSTFRTVDQTRFDLRWLYVGTFPFRGGEDARVTISNQSSASGVIIADAVKIGDGVGSIVRGGTTSGRLRWQECSRYHAQYFGAPSSVYNTASGEDNNDDVTCRPRYGEWFAGGQADLYLSLHTNATGGCGCASGTSTYIHDTSPTAGSVQWQQILHSRLINDLRAGWSPTWQDRGTLSANFGEVRELVTMPGCLVELAFHDNLGGDIEALHHPKFRAVAGRALYRAIHDYLAPGIPFALDPPKALAMTNNGFGGLVLTWAAVPGATAYRVRQSQDGFAFDEGQVISGTSFQLDALHHDTTWYAKVAAVNTGGTGIDSEPVGARVAPGSQAPLLLVNGFDRHDRRVKEHENPHHWLTVKGAAVKAVATAGYPFDGCTNEALLQGVSALSSYQCVGWILGEESTVDETFSGQEQTLVTLYLLSGGRFFFSGAEVGWDLDQNGSAADRWFYEQQLGQDYVSDDAGVYFTQAQVGGVLGALPAMQFDDGTHGAYNVDFPDVVQPGPGTGGQIVLRYITGGGAAVLHGNGRVIGLGFPLEALVDPAHRTLLMERILGILCPLAVQPQGLPVAGQNLAVDLDFPGSPNLSYVAAASLGSEPGLSLGDGRTIPLEYDALFLYSASPQPIFQNMIGNLDGQGQGQFQIAIPVAPNLSGFSFVVSAVSLNGTSVQTVAPWYKITLP